MLPAYLNLLKIDNPSHSFFSYALFLIFFVQQTATNQRDSSKNEKHRNIGNIFRMPTQTGNTISNKHANPNGGHK